MNVLRVLFDLITANGVLLSDGVLLGDGLVAGDVGSGIDPDG